VEGTREERIVDVPLALFLADILVEGLRVEPLDVILTHLLRELEELHRVFSQV